MPLAAQTPLGVTVVCGPGGSPEFSLHHPLLLYILCDKEILFPFIYFKLPTWPTHIMETMYCAAVLCLGFAGFFL